MVLKQTIKGNNERKKGMEKCKKELEKEKNALKFMYVVQSMADLIYWLIYFRNFQFENFN